MPASRNGRLKKVTALVPLAILSVAWTASIAGVGGTTAVAQQEPRKLLPDGTSVPSQAIEAPASVSTEGVGSLGTGTANATQIISTAATSGIPSVALAAYQRAETVINAADTTCKLPWQLVAAIGRVESNHGRANGNTLDDNGTATPGIYGLALDGTNATTLINDTDAGQYDNDTSYDRAVGPLQFIPSTWSVVGVDADGDGARNPQDINDAALGSAVYLCSGTDDLSTPTGQQAAIYRYNHSQSYVDLVLSVMAAYTAGDFTTVPNSTTAAGYLVPSVPAATGTRTGDDKIKTGTKSSAKGKGTKAPTAAPTTAAPTAAPTAPAPTGTDGGNNGPDKGGIKLPTKPGVPKATLVPPLPSTSIAPVDQILTVTQAVLQCTLDGVVNNPLDSTKFDACVKDYTS